MRNRRVCAGCRAQQSEASQLRGHVLQLRAAHGQHLQHCAVHGCWHALHALQLIRANHAANGVVAGAKRPCALHSLEGEAASFGLAKTVFHLRRQVMWVVRVGLQEKATCGRLLMGFDQFLDGLHCVQIICSSLQLSVIEMRNGVQDVANRLFRWP